MEGHIKIYRKFLDWEWYGDSNTCRLFLHMLLIANWKDVKFQGIVIPRGSFVSSIAKLSSETGLTVDEVRTAIKHLKSTEEITSKSHSKFSVFTIKNYGIYQDIPKQSPSTSQTEPKQVPTKEEEKESNNIINNKNHNVSSPTSGDRPAYPYEDIVGYLNEKAGTRFKTSSEDTRKHIRARINEGYTLDDFKIVIDKKVSAWKGTSQAIYLRPSTLFGPKFEGYLNEQIVGDDQRKQTPNRFHNFKQRDTNYDAMVAHQLKEKLRKDQESIA